MVKLILFIFGMFISLICFDFASAFCGDCETLKIIAYEDAERIDYISFTYHSGIAVPNALILEAQLTFKYKNPAWYNPTCEIEVIKAEYTFSGCTGDNIFEIRYIDTGLYSQNEKIRQFFEENDRVPLDLSVYSFLNCTENDRIFMKMLKLKDNHLEYQIIFPKCLKII
jgi:hypothetical protein